MKNGSQSSRMQLKRDVQRDAEAAANCIPPTFRPHPVPIKGLGSLDIGHMSEEAPCPEVKLF